MKTKWPWRHWPLLVAALAPPAPAEAQEAQRDERVGLHFQATVATQAHPSFSAAYSGRNSMSPDAESATSVVMDLFAGLRLWSGAEVYFQPELAGGRGLSSTLGVAAFPSGEVYRVGNPTPTIIPARIFLRQIIGPDRGVGPSPGAGIPGAGHRLQGRAARPFRLLEGRRAGPRPSRLRRLLGPTQGIHARRAGRPRKTRRARQGADGRQRHRGEEDLRGRGPLGRAGGAGQRRRSHFGNMFSVLGASAFLPFLPMLPIQILTQNLLYDFSQLAIPFDRVDEEYLLKPRQWRIDDIRRFMLFFGPVSSVFDYATFALLFFVFKANTPARQSLFQSGWFVEGLLSQTLIVHMIRTRKIPFLQSSPSLLALTTAAVMAVGIALPFSPFASSFGMVPLPSQFFAWLAAILLAYAALAQTVKGWYVRRYGYN